MKKEYSFLIALIINCITLSSCSRPATGKDIQYLSSEDSIYQAAMDSIYDNPLYTQQLLKKTLEETCPEDSFVWYNLYNLYIKAFFTAYDFDTILPMCRNTIRYCQGRAGTDVEKAELLMQDINGIVGNYYSMLNNNDSAIFYYTKNIGLLSKTNKHEQLVNLYNNIADATVRSGHYAEGAAYYRRALFLVDSLNLPAEKFIVLYTGLGQTYVELNDYENAHFYYAQTYRMKDKMDLNNRMIYHTNMGTLFYFEENYEAALQQFDTALSVLENNPEQIFFRNLCKINMGELYLLTGRLDSASVLLNDSYRYFRSIGNETAVYHAETLLLELSLRQNAPGAVSHLSVTSGTASPVEPRMFSLRKKYMQHFYEQAGDYRMAYQTLKERTALDDSIRNSKIKMRVAEIDLRYKQDTTLLKQTLFIRQQQNDMKSMKLSIYIWILICILALAAALFIYYYQKKQRAYLQIKHRNKIMELQMENIRNRVSPHFIFNTLNCVISGYRETDNKYQELHNLIKLMRLNLSLTEELCVSLEEELDFVRTYLDIEQQRFLSSPLKIDIHIANDIDPRRLKLPSMMIQIPVENSVKHGLRNKEGEKKLTISIIRENGDLIICIADNGCGYIAKANRNDSHSTGTGLRVITQTIELLNTENEKPLTFSIGPNPEADGKTPGCLVRFVIPEHYSFVFRGGK